MAIRQLLLGSLLVLGGCTTIVPASTPATGSPATPPASVIASPKPSVAAPTGTPTSTPTAVPSAPPVATSTPTDQPTVSPGASSAPTPAASASFSPTTAALLARVPEALRQGCSEVVSFATGFIASVQCLPDAIDGYVVYTLFDSVDNLRADYASDVDFFGDGATGDSCQTGPAELIYSIADVPAGRLMCNNYESGYNGLIGHWTREDLMIKGTIVLFENQNFQELYDLWQDAGPLADAPGTSPAPSLGGLSDWQDTAGEYRLQMGEQFAYQCPPNGTDYSVWGTDVYTDDSSVCTAAVHAGLITFASGGNVLIEIVDGLASYSGSERNGVTSSNWGSWDASFVFVTP